MIGQSDELHLPSVGHDSKKISPYDHLQNPALCPAGVYMWECRNAEIGSKESFFINQSDIIRLSTWSFLNWLHSFEHDQTDENTLSKFPILHKSKNNQNIEMM